MLNIIIGGGNLFAGPWLFFWTVGMLLREFEDKFKIAESLPCFFTNTLALIIWQIWFVNLEHNLTLQPVFHGSQVGMTWANALETVLLFFWFKQFTWIMEKVLKDRAEVIEKILCFWGKHSLYIFMYHMLFLDIYGKFFLVENFADRCLCISFILFGPVTLEVFVKSIRRYLTCILDEIEIR